jgi:hypothetical protein
MFPHAEPAVSARFFDFRCCAGASIAVMTTGLDVTESENDERQIAPSAAVDI